MELISNSKNCYVMANKHHRVECDLRDNKVSILKDNELEHYCKLVFPFPWNVSNLVRIQEVVSDKVLFEVDLKGNDVDEWINQLLRAFAEFLNDNEIIIGYHELDGVRVAKVL